MYPAFDKIREMAAAGDYKRIPICKELYADSYTPVEMMRILQKASHHCYLLESASQNEVWGRYSFLGYDPSMEITCTDGTLRIRINCLKRKRMLWKLEKRKRTKRMPFILEKNSQKRSCRLLIQVTLSGKSSSSIKAL